MSNEPNPFAPPGDDEGLPKYVPSSDPSVDHEPNRLNDEFLPDGIEEPELTSPRLSDDVEVENTVWDEPGLSTDLAGSAPRNAITYERWLSKKISETPEETTWLVTAFIGCFSGLLALPGTLFLGFQFGHSLVSICIFEPMAEEIVKIALAIWIVEKRPYLFKYAVQIIAVCICCGFVFSLIESFAARQFQFRNAQWLMANGPWSLAILLHIVCSTLAGLGIARVWRHCIETATKPQLSRGGAFIVAAVAIHVIYKCVWVVLSK